MLLIACANVANLVLVKTLARQKEIAIRTALGASSVRVARQILSETLLLALTGGILGLILAHFGVELIVAFLAQSLPRTTDITVDGWVLVFTLAISLLTGLAAGLVPAVRASKKLERLVEARCGPYRCRFRGQQDAQRAGSVGSCFVAGAADWRGIDGSQPGAIAKRGSGLELAQCPHHVIALSPTKYKKPIQQTAFYDQLLQRVRAAPGVASAGAIDSLPLGGGSTEPIAVEGRPQLPMSEQPEVAVRAVEPGLFQRCGSPFCKAVT